MNTLHVYKVPISHWPHRPATTHRPKRGNQKTINIDIHPILPDYQPNHFGDDVGVIIIPDLE